MLVVGELGSGVLDLLRSLHQEFEGTAAIAPYKGSSKGLLTAIAKQWSIPTTLDLDNGKSKAMSVEELKQEILDNCRDGILILPDGHRIPASTRYWLSDLLSEGVRIVVSAPVHPRKEPYLEFIEIDYSLPSDQAVREAMIDEARKFNLSLSEAQLADLQGLAGRNPMIGRKVVRSEALGIKQERPEHSQYLDIYPLVMAFFALLAILKFAGLAMGDRGLYIVGGVAMMLGMALRYLGKIEPNQKRLGG